jgi:putative CocE/NonD family hydrolase
VGILTMTRTTTRIQQRGGPSTAGALRDTVTFALVALSAFLSCGCEHDPVVLDSHPLDIFGATGRESSSLYIEMDDGVRIAVDVHLPLGLEEGTLFPTILEMTRYWRDRGEGPSYLIERAVNRGFAYVIMDERGTGGSFGSWPTPLSDRALEDAGEILDWIVEQPWSNGAAGATGISYPGMASHQLAATGHPALLAIVPMSDTYDQYEDLLFPGGVFNEVFMQGWSELVFAMDRNTTLEVGGELFTQSPVDADPFGELLEEAVAGHAGNLEVFPSVSEVTFRDDQALAGLTLDDLSTFSRAADINSSGVAVYHWGSWLDGGSADGAIRAFMESSGPRRGTIGSWTHDLSGNAYTGLDRWPSIPGLEAQWEEALNFFDDMLRKNKGIGDRILRYFTMGENLWKTTSTWPIPGTVTETLFLGENSSLVASAPTAAEAADSYQVDFEARSAIEPRWLGPLYADTWYSDRITRDQKLLVYQSAPLSEEMEVTGYPVVHLNLSSTHSDGAFFVYLEDVAPGGQVTYVTEGILRGIHRKVSDDPGSWKRPIPFHSYLSADAESMVPGEVVELAFGLHPTSFLFKEGHRIRIAIAGHDDSAFRRVPSEGTPELRVQRNTLYPSWIELPVIPR